MKATLSDIVRNTAATAARLSNAGLEMGTEDSPIHSGTGSTSLPMRHMVSNVMDPPFDTTRTAAQLAQLREKATDDANKGQVEAIAEFTAVVWISHPWTAWIASWTPEAAAVARMVPPTPDDLANSQGGLYAGEGTHSHTGEFPHNDASVRAQSQRESGLPTMSVAM
eukprot:5261181-Amphidinium_carterae.2